MNSPPAPRRSRSPARVAIAAVCAAAAFTLQAQSAQRNPVSKVFISDLYGEATIDTGDSIHEMGKRSVYNAQGSVIETKAPRTDSERKKSYSTMVYSNGTGAFFDSDTRVEVRRFVQEPFRPTRTDVDIEPSISQTQAYVARGSVGLCTSKLVAGSSMVYQTPHGAVQIRGRKVVIEASAEETKISMLEGESTVRAGPLDTSTRAIRAGEQAIIRSSGPGQPNTIEVTRIPPAEAPMLDDKVSLACMAKRTVYFDVRERPAPPAGTAVPEAAEEKTTASSTDSAGDAGTGAATAFSRGETGPASAVTAFDGNSAVAPRARSGQEIIAVPVVPATLPVPFTVSPASLVRPGS